MLILIDLDNTLGDRERAVTLWASEFVTTHGLPQDRLDWLLALDNDGYTSRAEVFETIATELSLDDPSTLLSRFQQRIVELTKPTPGAIECLTTLQRLDHQVVIVSNGSTVQQNAKIDHLSLRNLVDSVVISETVGVKKPNVEIFGIAARSVGCDLSNALMVGDAALHDILGAKRAGLATAWLHRGRQWDESLAEPDLILPDLHSLPSALPGLYPTMD